MVIHVGTLHEYIVDVPEYNESVERRFQDTYDHADNNWAVVKVRPWTRFDGNAIVTVRIHIRTAEVEREVVSALESCVK